MQIDHAFGNGEPQAETAILARDRAAALLEGIENTRQQIGLDPDPGIGNLHHDRCPASSFRVRAVIVAARGREFDRVFDQIPKDLLQARRVRPAMMLDRLEMFRRP